MRQEKEISKKYTIEQLSELTGYSRRTIRYYIEEGLISAPAGRGKGGFYFDSHLNKLLVIRKLQERGMSLSAISVYLKQDNESAQLYYDECVKPGAFSRINEGALPGAAQRANLKKKKFYEDYSKNEKHEMAVNELNQENIFFERKFSEKPIYYCMDVPQPRRDVWIKYEIAPGLEINVRREIEQEHKKRIEDILKIAKQMLGKDQG